MAGINLIKQLKAKKSGQDVSLPSKQKSFGLDLSGVGNEFKELSKADKFRIVMMVLSMASIYFMKDWVAGYTFEQETVKRQEMEAIDKELATEQAKVTAMKGLAQESEAYERQMAELRRKLSIIDGLGKNRNLAIRMVDFIVQEMPNDLWLSRIALDTKDDGKVEVLGNALNLQVVSDFLSRLEGAVFFPRWMLVETQKADGAGTSPARGQAALPADTRKFQMTARVVPL